MRKSFFGEEMGEEKFILGGNGRGKLSFWRKWVIERFLMGGNG